MESSHPFLHAEMRGEALRQEHGEEQELSSEDRTPRGSPGPEVPETLTAFISQAAARESLFQSLRMRTRGPAKNLESRIFSAPLLQSVSCPLTPPGGSSQFPHFLR